LVERWKRMPTSMPTGALLVHSTPQLPAPPSAALICASDREVPLVSANNKAGGDAALIKPGAITNNVVTMMLEISVLICNSASPVVSTVPSVMSTTHGFVHFANQNSGARTIIRLNVYGCNCTLRSGKSIAGFN
jgi:hypothetical protein